MNEGRPDGLDFRVPEGQGDQNTTEIAVAASERVKILGRVLENATRHGLSRSGMPQTRLDKNLPWESKPE